jgi:hypothetical protein
VLRRCFVLYRPQARGSVRPSVRHEHVSSHNRVISGDEIRFGRSTLGNVRSKSEFLLLQLSLWLGYGLGDRSSNPWPAMEPIQHSPGVKWPGREANHSPPSNAVVFTVCAQLRTRTALLVYTANWISSVFSNTPNWKKEFPRRIFGLSKERKWRKLQDELLSMFHLILSEWLNGGWDEQAWPYACGKWETHTKGSDLGDPGTDKIILHWIRSGEALQAEMSTYGGVS